MNLRAKSLLTMAILLAGSAFAQALFCQTYLIVRLAADPEPNWVWSLLPVAPGVADAVPATQTTPVIFSAEPMETEMSPLLTGSEEIRFSADSPTLWGTESNLDTERIIFLQESP